MENLFYSLECKERSNDITICEKSDLKTKLKHFAIRNHKDNKKENITSDQFNVIKGLRNNQEIVIQRPDKGGGVVVMDAEVYRSKLESLISDPAKFQKCAESQIPSIKREINSIAKKYKEDDHTKHIFKNLNRIGEYGPGHLYGLPKIHKNPTDPPLRPIISMTGTITHDVSKYLNNIIRPFIDQRYMLKSSHELLVHLKTVKIAPSDHLVSLDVESLFTNVPVNETIDIIIARCYNHPTLPPPVLPSEDLAQLLRICTRMTPFAFKNELYVQTDGVSMGSPLGPTFADFYVSNLENILLSQDKISNPSFYFRYVDDIIAVFKSKHHVKYFIRRLKNCSVLNFTVDPMVNNKFHFLDISMSIGEGGAIETGVYIKPTDTGLYVNFNSYLPDNYKISVIKTLVNRALTHSSCWNSYSTEIERLKQIFINNDYPLKTVENIIKKKMDNFLSNNSGDDVTFVDLYVRLFNLSNFSSDSKLVDKILQTHVRSREPNKSIRLRPYYRPFKISSMFSTRPKVPALEKSNVVYEFKCPESHCNASYIGYTTNRLSTRIKQHKYKSSSIYKHFYFDHSMLPPQYQLFSQNFLSLYSDFNSTNLRISEAILIKTRNPFINVKYNELYDFLKLF